MKTPYFAFYPQDWIADNKIMMMTLEEEGAYIKLLCHMWNFQGITCSLPNDDKFICRILRISSSKWKKLKSTLIDSEFAVFSIENSRIINKRLQKEYEIAKQKSVKAAENASKKWESERGKPAENKDSSSANASAIAKQTQSDGNANAEQTLCDGSAIHNHNYINNIKDAAANAREEISISVYETFFVNEQQFQFHTVRRPDVQILFAEWLKEKIPIEVIKPAVDYANAKLNEKPATPMYYKGFVKDALRKKLKPDKPRAALTKTELLYQSCQGAFDNVTTDPTEPSEKIINP